MTWVRIDDRMTEHPKVMRLSDAAFRIHISALCYAARNLTDGVLERPIVKSYGWGKRAAELVAAGVWAATEDGWVIHDYLDFNPSRVQVIVEREAARKRMEFARTGKRSSPEQTENFGGSSDNPVPIPSRPDPVPEESSPTVQIQTTPTRAKAAPKRVTVVDEAFEARMVERFKPQAPEARVREEIQKAMGHKAALKYHDLQAYVMGWLRDTNWNGSQGRYAGKNGASPTYSGVNGHDDVWGGLINRE